MFWNTKDQASIIDKSTVNRFIRAFAKNDNWHEIDKASGNLGYGWIHYAFIRAMRPARVLCVGSKYGFIPAICALASKENQKGRVDFIDANYSHSNPDQKNHWGGVGYWSTNEGKHVFESFGLQNHITTHVMTTTSFIKRFPKKTWNYVYLDGDHSYRGIQEDYNYFWPKLNKGGIMCFHDIKIAKREGTTYGVKRFWKDLKKRRMHSMLELGGSFGLGLLQK